MYFLISDIIVIFILLFLFALLSAVWPPDSPWAPWWQMPDDVCFAAARHAKIKKKDVIYDLGCGTGKALIVANLKFEARGVGIEIDPVRAVFAKWQVWKNKALGVKIIKQNFFNVDISEATVIYMYLVPNALRRLTNKLTHELRPGTKIVSYVYDLPETYKGKVKLLKKDKKNSLYVYELLKAK